MAKRLLILGNGFDLAHDLPTRYSDFLDFAKRLTVVYTMDNSKGDATAFNTFNNYWIKDWGEKQSVSRDKLKEILLNLFRTRTCEKEANENNPSQYTLKVTITEKLDMFFKCINQNIWFDYIFSLYESRKIRGENWIDFESEISYIIQTIDNHHDSLGQSFIDLIKDLKNLDSSQKMYLFMKSCDKAYEGQFIAFNQELYQTLTVRVARTHLYNDLEKLISAFEIYLTEIVGDFNIDSPQKSIADLSLDYVINFNYTKTFEKYYNDSIPVCHIHGECDNNRPSEENNMVLGIDEYLDEFQMLEQTDFSIFKKFVQRIRKHNDVSYSSWAKEIDEDDEISDVYIYGHSLDVTDKDILRRFLVSSKTRIHIFTRDKASEGDLISNLLKIVDENIVIEKATTNPPMIAFIKS